MSAGRFFGLGLQREMRALRNRRKHIFLAVNEC